MVSQSSPGVSVVIPVYNRAKLVRDAVASIPADSAQLTIEIVIVDDASTDDTWQTVSTLSDPRIRAIRMDRNGGQARARNEGMRAVRGSWIKFLDSDDVLAGEHLRREYETAVTSDADIVVSGWCSASIDGSGPITEYPAPVFGQIIDDVLAGVAVPTSAALYRHAHLPQWDSALGKLDDWDFFCQTALRASSIATAKGPAYTMREHTGPRVTHVSLATNAHVHHQILRKIENNLAARDLLTEARRRRLAQYFYKEIRILAVHDPAAATAALEHIFELDPSFLPREEERVALIRMLARVIGVRNMLRLYAAWKRRRM